MVVSWFPIFHRNCRTYYPMIRIVDSSIATVEWTWACVVVLAQRKPNHWVGKFSIERIVVKCMPINELEKSHFCARPSRPGPHSWWWWSCLFVGMKLMCQIRIISWIGRLLWNNEQERLMSLDVLLILDLLRITKLIFSRLAKYRQLLGLDCPWWAPTHLRKSIVIGNLLLRSLNISKKVYVGRRSLCCCCSFRKWSGGGTQVFSFGQWEYLFAWPTTHGKSFPRSESSARSFDWPLL